MKYALEYDQMDQNTLIIHFNKELIKSSASPKESMDTEITHECATHGDNSTMVDDSKDDNDNISPCLKMMGDTIYSLNGVRDVEICDYEIILVKSLFFEWKWIVDSVIATVLIFLYPGEKATETPFAYTCGKNNKKGKKNKKNSKKTAEISWKFQET